MTLDEQVLGQVRSALGVGRGKAPAGNGRRRAERVGHRGTATLYPWRGYRPGPPVTVVVQDFSATGLGVVYSRQAAPGEQFLMRLPRESGQPVWIVCRVARCDRVGDGLFAVGLAFEQETAAVEGGDALAADAA